MTKRKETMKNRTIRIATTPDRRGDVIRLAPGVDSSSLGWNHWHRVCDRRRKYPPPHEWLRTADGETCPVCENVATQNFRRWRKFWAG